MFGYINNKNDLYEKFCLNIFIKIVFGYVNDEKGQKNR